MNKLVKCVGLSTILLLTVANDRPGMRVYGEGRAAECYRAAAGIDRARDAFDVCTDALEQGRSSLYEQVATYNNRGVIQMARNDRAALSDFDDAIATDPTRGEPYLNKAILLMRRDNGWREALPLLDKAIEYKAPRAEIAYYGRGVAHELAGNLRAAYADYSRAAQLAPKWNAPRQELQRFRVGR